MCRSHWNLVPSALKIAILKAWNNEGPGSPAYTAAMDAALKAITPKTVNPNEHDKNRQRAVL
jgi:hypothetical protein